MATEHHEHEGKAGMGAGYTPVPGLDRDHLTANAHSKMYRNDAGLDVQELENSHLQLMFAYREAVE